MRAVTAVTVAAALQISQRALNNLLEKAEIPDLPKGRQGLERRIPISAVSDIVMAHELVRFLGVSTTVAWRLVPSLRTGELQLGDHLNLRVDREVIERRVAERLAAAIEMVVRKRRGRPPGRR